ncbi:hypothetical protein A3A49_01670 [Candidatus Curtissbacteria bacterium RIFCSPLOWO2_01_FULL_38_11b]|uniref:Histidine kinase/HSP90-like ATPase domain-containing protein n=1 Tax=Candidatus Curtissbacteria bacterium RIFCSPLOWO2_01_FULL_38_11b TaxID=1797725 RepID=A0A1F5H0H5_9BACT|nr:MAG: hypothetical protein A3A49_01670 [Candidatus Curtissbacteria bacterium RIFCSPLOWO2_01_FULL_38_11b]
MKIHLPNSAFLGNVDPFLASFNPNGKDTLEISFNKKWIFVHPLALSMVAALALTVDSSNIVCEQVEARSGHYLERMGLFDFLKVKSGISISEHEPAGRFIPLTQIKNSNKLSDFLKDMIPLLHLEPKHAESIQYIVSELVRNVLEHSASPNGAVLAAQYFKKSNTIRIGIADTGLGIKETINVSYPADNYLEAIRLALMPGITGTTTRIGGTDDNAGAGLFFIKSIANVNRDFFMIYSGDSMYKLLRKTGRNKRHVLYADPNKDQHSKRNDLPFWQGTAVGIDISLDATSEFTALLDYIRDTYSKAVRERKQAKYKKAKFI